jgi:phosphatidylglycerol lysyltransferase
VIKSESKGAKSPTPGGAETSVGRISLWAIALITAASGLVNIYSVLGDIPPDHARILAKFLPIEFQVLSRYLTLLIGFALVVSSVSILRRKRMAFWLVLTLCVLSVISHLTKGIAYEGAAVSLVLLAVLLLNRKRFVVGSGIPDLRLAVIRAAAGVLIVFCYGITGFWLLDEKEFGINFDLTDSFKRTASIISLTDGLRLTPHTAYARWFIESAYLMTIAAITYAGLAFFRPVIYRFRWLPRERLLAARVTEGYGRSSLDFFKLWPDKSYYFNETSNCFIAFSVANNLAIALADPAGPEDEVEETVRSFMSLCRSNDWGVAFYQVPPDCLPIYKRLGLKRLKIGDEARVYLKGFNLEGRHRKKLRSNVRRFEERGYRIVECEPPLNDEVVRKSKEVSDDWLSLPGRRERRFTLGSFNKAYLRATPLYALVDGEGTFIAFVNRIKSYRPAEATIDLMRHRADAPNGAMDYLFTKLFLDCKAKGYEWFSLGMAPLAGFREGERPGAQERAIHYVISHLNSLFNYSGLRRFKAKYADEWEPRYLIYQHAIALPQVAIALMKASEMGQAKHDFLSDGSPLPIRDGGRAVAPWPGERSDKRCVF